MVFPQPRGQLLYEQDFVSYSAIGEPYIDDAVQTLARLEGVPSPLLGKELYDTGSVISKEFEIVSWQLSQCRFKRYSGSLTGSNVKAWGEPDRASMQFRLRDARDAVAFSFIREDDVVIWNAERRTLDLAAVETQDIINDERDVAPLLLPNETAVRALCALKMTIRNIRNDVV